MASQRPVTPGTSKERTPSPPRRATEENRAVLNFVTSYFKKAVVIIAAWVAGFYKFSPSWLLLALIVYVWKEKRQATKQQNIATAQEIAKDEKGAILARVEDLPSWVYFPDVERAEWVNKVIDQLWPFIGEYVRKLLKDTVEPKIKVSLPASLGSFKFSRIDLGDIPPRIGGVKVYTSQVKRDEIYLDLEINYASDSNLAVQVKGMNFGVRDLTLRGTLRVIVRPLINKTPLIGGLSVFFLNNPELDFNLTNLANALDLPGLNEILHSIIEDQIAETMVLPNRIPIQIADDVDIRKLRCPLPQGVLRVHVVEAKDLVHADTKLFGEGKSDPYAIVSVGAQSYQTTVINNTVTPTWNQTFEYVIDERDGQLLKVEVKDRDTGSKDDHLGSTTLDISVIYQKGSVEEWLPLEEVTRGIIHLDATWLYLSKDPNEFTEMQQSTKEEDYLNTALLVVHLDSASCLPRGKRSLQEPSPFVLLTVGQVTQESSIRAATTDPTWEQDFRFFVANPNHQSLDIEVQDSKTNRAIAEMRLHLKNLMTADNMMMEQKFPLKSMESGSALFMTVILRILTPYVTPEWLRSESNTSQEKSEDAHDKSRALPAEGPSATETDPAGDLASSTLAAETVPHEAAPPPLPERDVPEEAVPSPFPEKYVPDEAVPSPLPERYVPDEAASSPLPERYAPDEAVPSPLPERDVSEETAPSPLPERDVVQPPASPALSMPDLHRRKSASSSSSPESKKDDSGVFGLGRVQLTLRYSSSRQHLVVVLHKIVNLKPADGDSKGLADPYINMYLVLDGDHKAKRKTEVIKKNLNPVFDAKFEFAVSIGDLGSMALEVRVKNETGLFSSSQKLLGLVLVDLSSLDVMRTVTQWLDLSPRDSLKASTLMYDE